MNRREFTASLAALAASPAIPLAAPAAAAPTALPPGAYLWAELIARAQNTCSPALIAKQLRISTAAAEGLFGELLRDGVLKAPGFGGFAQAAKPLQVPGGTQPMARRVADKVTEWMDTGPAEVRSDDVRPLVNADDPSLGCAETASKDPNHASADQSPEDCPESG